MAGEWLKMRTNLWDDPRVTKLCDLTEQSEAAVIGGLYWLWAMADEHTENGVLPGLTLRSIDRKTGVAGLGAALVAIGWVADHPEGIRIVKFEEHNGFSAKKRCSTAKRVSLCRNGNADVTQPTLPNEEVCVTPALAREDKRREEKRDTANRSPDKLPTCPTQAIVDLYHEALPELPAVKLMPDKRKKAISAFWKFALTAKRSDGTPRATNADEAIDWAKQFFERARDNDFLMGRRKRSDDHATWRCDLDFLMTEKGRIFVIEKTKEIA